MMTSLRNDFDQEYHSFGPWLIEIKDADNLPPQYRAIEAVIESAIFSFKVPVGVDRKDAKPGMILYKQIVCLTEDRLIRFKIDDHKLKRSDTAYDAITYLTKSCDLLANQLLIGTKKGTITIDYNAISEDIINVALVHIRTQLLKLPEKPTGLKTFDFSDHVSMMLRNLIALEPVTTPLNLIAHQPTTRIANKKATFIRRLISIISPPVVQESAFFASSEEMIIYTRHKQTKGSRDVDYGYNFTYVPLIQLTSVTLQASELYKDLSLIDLHLGTLQLTVQCKDQLVARTVKAFSEQQV